MTADIQWPEEVAGKIAKLEELLKTLDRVLVAYSGGVDSTFLAVFASRIAGLDVLAVTMDSAVMPRREIEEAGEIAETWSLNHLVVEADLFHEARFADNPEDRCYYCKKLIFKSLLELAREKGYPHVLDGSNVDDESDYRPGARATRELGVRSPLKEAGLTKAEIRAASRALDLPTSDKPAYACLASRIPYGHAITSEKLMQVERAEDGLLALGFRQSRVRMHDDTARIELEPDDIQRAAEPAQRAAIADLMETCGFRYAALDLRGYRQGSMNKRRMMRFRRNVN